MAEALHASKITGRSKATRSVKIKKNLGPAASRQLPRFLEERDLEIAAEEVTVLSPMRILLVDDDAKITKHVKQALVAEGYAADVASDGEEAVWLAENNPYDLLILDVMMPSQDGFGVARHLRRKDIQTPILFLTARQEVEDRVRGLDVGGDDYMVKPFSVTELLARVRALLRRQRSQSTNTLRYEDLELDLISRTARRGGHNITLTNREFALLELLLTMAPKPVSTAVIVERVWDQCFDSSTNVVNVYMSHLRGKINLPDQPPLLHTLRGVGFALRKNES
jgi:two-component system, OmpR family, copper resistance phosphate regulon response regulator CusR